MVDLCDSYEALFRQTTGNEPYPYQIQLAVQDEMPDLMDIPTGLGKTAAVVLAWLWRRRFAEPAIREATARRFIYCLPMRVLVEQTESVVRTWLHNLDLSDTVKVHVLMGGEDVTDWDLHPERDAILIGTQDMLLSRALNRGYGMSRYRWPVHFGLLNNDCLWVFDETQLMGVGVTTSAQLRGLRTKLSVYGSAQSLWMSATLNSGRLSTVDHPEPDSDWRRVELGDEDRRIERVQKLIEAAKPCKQTGVVLTPEGSKSGYPEEVAAEIVQLHREGTLTLAVINRVDRAQEIFQAIQKVEEKADSDVEVLLIHSRFRPHERFDVQSRALNEMTIPDAGRIVVSTQAIEAGVDVSATTLFTELAPWSSMVQRFGRCNRRGVCGAEGKPDAQVAWIDIDTSDPKKSKELALPYSADELNTSREHIAALSDVGPAFLESVAHEEPCRIDHTIRRKDLLELWDTTPDLAGNDLDVSRYIRDGEDTDVQMYWREWDKKQDNGRPPDPRDGDSELVFPAPSREELCGVSIAGAKKFLERLRKLKANKKADVGEAWRWNPLDRIWERIDQYHLRPGMVLLLHVDAGGYDAKLGWTGETERTESVELERMVPPETNDGDELGCHPVLLTHHLHQAAEAARDLKESFYSAPDGIPWESIITGALWHDVGKAHEAFRTAMQDFDTIMNADPEGQELWAKSGTKGIPNYRMIEDDEEGKSIRRGFRHELASALAWLAQCNGEADADLIAFLIAAHHGKVRGSIRSLPNENQPAVPGVKFARGVWDDDEIPPVELENGQKTHPVKVDLSLMELGEDEKGRPSWLARVLKLRGEFGPFRLAFLETLVRIADWHGSEEGDKSDVQ